MPSKISLHSHNGLLRQYLKTESVNAKVCSYLAGSRTLKAQSNWDVDLSRIHDVTVSLT